MYYYYLCVLNHLDYVELKRYAILIYYCNRMFEIVPRHTDKLTATKLIRKTASEKLFD